MEASNLQLCEYCLHILGRIRPGNHEHHVFGRHNSVTIRMCYEHHSEAYHTEGRITREMIVERILVPYHWNGEDRSSDYVHVSKARRIQADRGTDLSSCLDNS